MNDQYVVSLKQCLLSLYYKRITVCLEVSVEFHETCWWRPSTFVWKESANPNTQDSSLTSKSWKIPMCRKSSKLAMKGWKFAPLTIMNNEDTDMDSMITTFNTAVTETASESLGKHRQEEQTNKQNLGHCRNSWSAWRSTKKYEFLTKCSCVRTCVSVRARVCVCVRARTCWLIS